MLYHVKESNDDNKKTKERGSIMKKRLVSLILALVLVFGAVAAPAFTSNAAKKVTYTKIALKSVQSEVDFYVPKTKRATAAKNLAKTLNAVLPKGKTLAVKVNGKSYTAKKTGAQGKGNIYVGSTKLADFIAANGSASTNVTVKVNLKKAVKLVKLAKKTGSYGYAINVTDAEIKSLKVAKSNKITFKGNGAKFTAYVKGGYVYLKGNKKSSKFVKNLKKAGAVASVKTVKVKTATLSK